MNITLTLTDAQAEALTRSNAQAHPNPGDQQTLEEFVQSILDAKAQEHVASWFARDAENISVRVKGNILTMTPEDKATMTELLEKYEIPPPKQVPPVDIVDEPIP